MVAAPGAQRVLGALVHVSPLAVSALVPTPSGWGLFTGPLGPLLVLLVVGRRAGFLRRQTVEALNFQVLAAAAQLVVLVLGTALTLLTFGIGLFVMLPASIGVGLVALVLQVVAAVRAGLGIEHRYPYPASWRLVR